MAFDAVSIPALAPPDPKPARPSLPEPATVVRLPGWAVLAAQRDEARRGSSAEDGLDRFGRLVLLPCAVGGMGLVALVVTVGWLAALASTAAAAAAMAVVLQMPASRRWRQRREASRIEHDAVQMRARMVGLIRRDDRIELERLTALVENVREHQRSRHRWRAADADVVRPTEIEKRLDAMLLAFIDRAIELSELDAAFAATAADEPGLPDLGALLDEAGDRELANVRDRAFRIVRLRESARQDCQRRIRRLRAELDAAGQVVRLVHEQSLCSHVGGHELVETFAELVDEAELAREAGDEAAAMVGGLVRGDGTPSTLQPRRPRAMIAAPLDCTRALAD